MSADLERAMERTARKPRHPLDVGALPRRATRLKLQRFVAAGTAVMLLGGGGAFAVANWDRGPRYNTPVVAPAEDECEEIDFDLAVYLRDDITDLERSQLLEMLEEDLAVEGYREISKAEAFEKFKLFYEDQPEFYENLPRDALPAFVEVTLTQDASEDDRRRLTAEVRELPGIDGARSAESLEQSRREACERRNTPTPSNERIYAAALEYGTEFQPQVLFVPTHSGFVTQVEPPRPVGIQEQNWAWASNRRLRGNIESNPHPAEALRRLPSDGIFITGVAMRLEDIHLSERRQIRRVELPFDIDDAAVSESYEGQVLDHQPKYSLFGRTGDIVVQIEVVFGDRPTGRMLNEAQVQLDQMHVRPGLREVAYNGGPLPDPVKRHDMDSASIEVPVGWHVMEPTGQPPSEFVITSYEYAGRTRSCADEGLFGEMPEHGVAIVGYPNGPFEELQELANLHLDPTTYLNYEGWGCRAAYKINVGGASNSLSLLVFFGTDAPSDRTLALTLQTLNSLRLP